MLLKVTIGALFSVAAVLGVLTFTTRPPNINDAQWNSSHQAEMLVGRTISWPLPGDAKDATALVLLDCASCYDISPFEIAERAGADFIVTNGPQIEQVWGRSSNVPLVADSNGAIVPTACFAYGSCVLSLEKVDDGRVKVLRVGVAPSDQPDADWPRR